MTVTIAFGPMKRMTARYRPKTQKKNSADTIATAK